MSGAPQRVYIAAADAAAIERMLLAESSLFPVGGTGDGRRAWAEISRLTPELLVLDSALVGMDGMTLMERMRREMLAPPRTLMLLPGTGWRDAALDRGADMAVCNAERAEGLLKLLETLAAQPLPALARDTEEMRFSSAGVLLMQLRVPAKLKGRNYMQAAAAYCACAPHLARDYQKRLYPLLADQFATTPQAVERAIRTAVENTWLRGDLAAIQRLFGFSVDAERGKPTNAEFIAMLTEHVRRACEKRLGERR